MKRLIYAALLMLFLGCGKDEVKEIEKIKKVEQINDEEMALPTTGITTSMVRNILGESTNSVGALCTSLNINMWSKRKPVIDNRVEVPFADVGKSSGVAAEGAGWGLNVPGWIGDDNAITTYNRPFGGVNSPFRLGDFRGYEHTAKNPIRIGNKPAYLRSREEIIVVAISQNSTNSIPFNDLFGDLRLGVWAYQSGTPFNSASAKNAGGGVVVIDLSGLTGDITIKFGLTDRFKDWADVGGVDMLYELPRAYVGDNLNWNNIPIKPTTYIPPGGDGGGGGSVGFLREDANSNMDYINNYLWIRLNDIELDKWIDARLATTIRADFQLGRLPRRGSAPQTVGGINNFTFTRGDTFTSGSGWYEYRTSELNLFDETDYTVYIDILVEGNWRSFGFAQFRTFIDPTGGGDL